MDTLKKNGGRGQGDARGQRVNVHNLECPKCNHRFCGGCLRESWKVPLVFRLDRFVGRAEIVLRCCACMTKNPARHWNEKKEIVQPKQTAEEMGQRDFFKDH